MKINVTPRARRDQNEIVEHLAPESLDAALLFISKLHETYGVIGAQPRVGHLRADMRGDEKRPIRCLTVNGFPNHLVFYQVAGEDIDVVRILHGARDIESVMENPED